jgi:uroporphyrinogen decarboxylase
MSVPHSTKAAASPQRKLLEPFKGHALMPPPIWLMRQAGRYLAEYREMRAKAGGFLDLCYTPALAAEVTLQPIRRFGFDAAILFSDILVVPDALGQTVEFRDGEGPRLAPVRSVDELRRLDRSATASKFGRIFEAVARIRQDLPAETALIGFCGAPWTVATYMVGGAGSSDQAEARTWAYRDRSGFAALMDLLVEVSTEYLSGQIEAGADVVQIFDSWAGSLPDDEFERWVIAPTGRIVRLLEARHPEVPVIGFPRGAGRSAERYVVATGVGGLGCDTTMPLAAMRQLAEGSRAVMQGNLDPLLLAAGGPAMEARVREILDAMRGARFIFNLGHGIVPETPPENVARLVELVRSARP